MAKNCLDILKGNKDMEDFFKEFESLDTDEQIDKALEKALEFQEKLFADNESFKESIIKNYEKDVYEINDRTSEIDKINESYDKRIEEAKAEESNKGTKGEEEVSGEDGKKSGVDRDGEGVPEDSRRDKAIKELEEEYGKGSAVTKAYLEAYDKKQASDKKLKELKRDIAKAKQEKDTAKVEELTKESNEILESINKDYLVYEGVETVTDAYKRGALPDRFMDMFKEDPRKAAVQYFRGRIIKEESYDKPNQESIEYDQKVIDNLNKDIQENPKRFEGINSNLESPSSKLVFDKGGVAYVTEANMDKVKPGMGYYPDYNELAGVIKEVFPNAERGNVTAILTDGRVVKLRTVSRKPLFDSKEDSDKNSLKEYIFNKIDSLVEGDFKSYFYEAYYTYSPGKGRVSLPSFASLEDLQVIKNYVDNLSDADIKTLSVGIKYGAVITIRNHYGNPYIEFTVGSEGGGYGYELTYEPDRRRYSSQDKVTGRSSYGIKPNSALTALKNKALEYGSVDQSVIDEMDYNKRKRQSNKNKKAVQGLTKKEKVKYTLMAPFMSPSLAKTIDIGATLDVLLGQVNIDHKFYPIASMLRNYKNTKKNTVGWMTKNTDIWGGYYDRGRNFVKINRTAPTSTIIHEAIHAVSSLEIDKFSASISGKKGKEYLDGLRKLIKERKGKDSANQSVVRLAELYLESLEVSGVMEEAEIRANNRSKLFSIEEYGFTNLHEFIAEGLSNRIFAARLNRMTSPSAKEGTIWSEFVKALADFLNKLGGIEVTNGSILEGLLLETQAIFEANDTNNFKPVSNDIIASAKEEKTQRQQVEAQVDSMLDENMSEEEIIESFPTSLERMLAEDILERKKSVDGKKALEKMNNSYEKAKKKMNEKKSTNFLNKALRSFARNWFDRQYLPKMILNRAGGKLIRNYMIAMKGAPGYAKYRFDKAYDKIYKGLSDKSIDTLNKIILQRRFIAIDENRESRGLDPVVHPDFQNRDTAKAALRELKNQIGEKEFKDLNKRADAYFNEFRELLNDMQESGIISQEFRDNFFDVDYQPRQFLQFLTTQEQEMSIVEMGIQADEGKLTTPQIRALENGSDESLITDSMYLLGRSMSARASAIAMNNTLNKFEQFMVEQGKKVADMKANPTPKPSKTKGIGLTKDGELTSDYLKWKKEQNTIKYFEKLQQKVKLNPIVSVSPSGKPKYKFKVGANQKAQTYYKDGVKHQMIMDEAFYDQFNDNLKGWFKNSNVRERVALFSLSGLVKTIATGNNPAFFITNTPRDFMFIATFSEEYGGNVAVNLLKIAKDTTQGIRDMGMNLFFGLVKLEERTPFQEFVKHGGMLDYLHKQGDFKGTTGSRRLFEKMFDNKTKEKGKGIFNFVTAQKIQMYSEIGFRMGVFRRSIKNQLKELGLKNIEQATPEQMQDIYTNAAASARNTTDFSQGGIYAKDADKLIPYLNAGVQGTRVAVEALGNRPLQTSLRMVQTATLLSALPIGLSLAAFASSDEEDDMTATERYLDAMRSVSMYDKTNYQIIFTGKKDKDGEYQYIRVSKPHFLTPLISYAQSLQHNVMRESLGMKREDPQEAILFALEKNISPVEFSVTGNLSKNPLLKAALTYTTGYDFYRNQDLSYKRGKVPVPVEGHESKSVEEFYKIIGEQNMISPARMKGAAESIITTPSTSPFVGLLYGGLDIAVADGGLKNNIDKVGKTIGKSFTGRFLKTTSEYNRRVDWDKKFEREFVKKEIDMLRDRAKIKLLADDYQQGLITDEQVNKEFNKLAKKDVNETMRLLKVFEDVLVNPKKDITVIDLKYRPPYQRALILASIFGDDLLKSGQEFNKQDKKLRESLFSEGIINDETIIKYEELIKGD